MTYLKLILVVGVAVFSYLAGYDKAEDKYKLEISEKENAQQTVVIDDQEKAKEDYEAKLKKLVADYNDERKRYDDRLRQLEAKLRSGGDLEAVTRQRDNCFRLVVEGEKLLRESEQIVTGLKK